MQITRFVAPNAGLVIINGPVGVLQLLLKARHLVFSVVAALVAAKDLDSSPVDRMVRQNIHRQIKTLAG